MDDSTLAVVDDSTLAVVDGATPPVLDAPGTTALRRALADFVAPARADGVAASFVDEHGPDTAVDAAVRWLRDDYGVATRDVAVAFVGAGVGATRLAALLGVGPAEVNGWVDEELAAGPAATDPGVPRGLVALRGVVRVVWIGLVLALVAVVVRSGVDLLPCRDPVCLEVVEVGLDDGRVVPAPDGEVLEAADVASVRFEYRDGQRVDGVVRWTVDGEVLATTRVTLTGDGVATVPAPSPRLPSGVHVVELTAGDERAAAVFGVEP